MSRIASEMQLQSRLRNDDRSALEVIYKSHQHAFINYAIGFNISKTEASDIYQDSIIALYQNFVVKKLQLKSSSIKTYLFGIGKHKIYNYLKEKKQISFHEHESNDYEEIKLNDIEPTDIQIQLANNLNLISESCQLLLRLFYYRGLSIDEIIEQTTYKDSNTVRSHKSRCLKRLKTLFKVN